MKLLINHDSKFIWSDVTVGEAATLQGSVILYNEEPHYVSPVDIVLDPNSGLYLRATLTKVPEPQ